MKRLIAALLCAALCLALSGCGSRAPESGNKLSFKSAASYKNLKKLDGQTVEISGYMATSSPVDGSFFFLMNLPYQSCPFCKPNTSQLSNTMEVYPKKGRSFDYTNQAVRVVGTLEVAPSEEEPFTDEYGYEFNFKVVDAEYYIISGEEMGERMALWQKLAQADIVNDIYGMYDYLNFLCSWDTYYVNNYTDENGDPQPGYYLYAADAMHAIKTEGAQFNYGYKDGYFDGIVKSIEKIDATEFADLIENVKQAKELGEYALGELESGHYTKEFKYVEKFDNSDYVYTLDKSEELNSRWDELYGRFADWLGSWEM